MNVVLYDYVTKCINKINYFENEEKLIFCVEKLIYFCIFQLTILYIIVLHVIMYFIGIVEFKSSVSKVCDATNEKF